MPQLQGDMMNTSFLNCQVTMPVTVFLFVYVQEKHAELEAHNREICMMVEELEQQSMLKDGMYIMLVQFLYSSISLYSVLEIDCGDRN